MMRREVGVIKKKKGGRQAYNVNLEKMIYFFFFFFVCVYIMYRKKRFIIGRG